METRYPDVQAILFDKDGTLFDFRRTWIPIIRAIIGEAVTGTIGRMVAPGQETELLRVAGYDIHADRFDAEGPIAAGNAADIARAWQTVVPDMDVARIEQAINELSASRGPGSSVPVCDLYALLRRIRGAGIRCGLATSDSESAARATLARFGIGDEFEWVSGYDSGFGVKPDPAVIRAFASSLGVGLHAIAMVGDTLHDMHMGRRAGVGLTVAVLSGAIERDVLEPHADRVVASIADLPQLLGIGRPD